MQELTPAEFEELWESLEKQADYIHHYPTEHKHNGGYEDAFFSLKTKVREEAKRRGLWWAKHY